MFQLGLLDRRLWTLFAFRKILPAHCRRSEQTGEDFGPADERRFSPIGVIRCLVIGFTVISTVSCVSPPPLARNAHRSKWELPLLERVEQLVEKKSQYPFLIPPKRYRAHRFQITWSKIQAQFMSYHPPERDRRHIDQFLNALNRDMFATDKASISVKFRFTSAKTHPLCRTSEEAYSLAFPEPDRLPLITYCSTRGLWYSLQTFRELVSCSESVCTLSAAEVEDWPTFSLRLASGRDVAQNGLRDEVRSLGWLPEMRMNGLLLDAEPKGLSFVPPLESYQRAALAIGKQAARDQLVEFGILINPYLFSRTSDGRPAVSLLDKKMRRALWDTIRSYRTKGARIFFLRTDDFAPRFANERFGYTFATNEEESRFGSLAQGHLELLRSVRRAVGPRSRLLFVPPWYNLSFFARNTSRAGQYLQEFGRNVPKQVEIFWTGPEVRSLAFKPLQYRKFQQLLHSRAPQLWDNTLYARRADELWGRDPNRAHLTSVLEPYDVQWPVEILRDPEATRVFYTNGHVTELFRIQMATVGAFLWNPEQYQPEVALWKYLGRRFGVEGAESLLKVDYHLARMKRERLLNNASRAENERKLGKNELDRFSSIVGQEGDKLVSELQTAFQDAEKLLPVESNKG
jgi:hypothetical protein